jgi:FKBP-type peptidyl-prolyl cis-trans isomerase SlyD
VRDATAEEIEHEHVHGAHGHHHGHEEMEDSEPGDHFRSQPLQ